ENAIYAVSIDRHATLERVRVVSGGTPSGGVLARPGTVLRDTAIVAEDGLAVAAVLDSVLAGTPIDLVNVTALSGAYAGLRVMISAVDGHVRMDNTIARTRDGAHDVDVLAPTGGADVRFSASHSSF